MNCWMVTDLGIITNMTLDYHDDDDEYWIMKDWLVNVSECYFRYILEREQVQTIDFVGKKVDGKILPWKGISTTTPNNIFLIIT
jgi:hypothetical protein